MDNVARFASVKGVRMEPLNSDQNPYRPPDGSLEADPVDAVHHRGDFSWKRVLKLFACLLSMIWVAMLYVMSATEVSHRRANAGCARSSAPR